MFCGKMISLLTCRLPGCGRLSCGRLSPVCLLLLFTGLSVHASELAVSAEMPEITIQPQSEGSRFLQLPALEYRFFLEAKCTTGFAPESLSVGIADSRKSLGSSEIPEQEPFEVTLPVPADQVGPVALHSFCRNTDPRDSGTETLSLLIPAVVSAQLSLTCMNDSSREISYASAPVDVLLNCERVPVRPDTEGSAADP